MSKIETHRQSEICVLFDVCINSNRGLPLVPTYSHLNASPRIETPNKNKKVQKGDKMMFLLFSPTSR